MNVEFENPISADEARAILRSAPGVMVIDKREPGGYITPHEAAGEDATYVSRIREDITVENGLAFWCVSDNLRKGAALNAIQIAEALVNRGLLQAEEARRPEVRMECGPVRDRVRIFAWKVFARGCQAGRAGRREILSGMSATAG